MDSFSAPVDGAAVLTALLERSGVEYRREEKRFRFLFARDGCKWQTVCDCKDDFVLVYAVHPAFVQCPDRARLVCDRLNGRVLRGGFFVQDDHIVYRTGADLFDGCDAAETLTRSIEYNASVMAHFWPQIAAAGEGKPPTIN